MKKLLTAVLAISMLASYAAIAYPANAAEISEVKSAETITIENSGENLIYGDYEYSISKNNVVIEKYKGKEENPVIPDKIDGKTVVEIGYEAFYKCNTLKKVTIPDSVTAIGTRAFSACENLKSVHISDNVTTMGEYAFSKCTELEELNYPKKLTKSDKDVIAGCEKLSKVEVPD